MKPPPIPTDEPERLAALRRYELLDTVPEQVYDDLRAWPPVSAGPRWRWSRWSMPSASGSRRASAPAHGDRPGLFLLRPRHHRRRDVRACRTPPRTSVSGNPLVVCAPGIRFYAGAPLLSSDGHALGTLCVIDRTPRRLRTTIELLRALGRMVMSQIELRLHIAERREIELAKNEFVTIVSHELRTPLTSIRGSLGLIEGGARARSRPRSPNGGDRPRQRRPPDPAGQRHPGPREDRGRRLELQVGRSIRRSWWRPPSARPGGWRRAPRRPHLALESGGAACSATVTASSRCSPTCSRTRSRSPHPRARRDRRPGGRTRPFRRARPGAGRPGGRAPPYLRQVPAARPDGR